MRKQYDAAPSSARLVRVIWTDGEKAKIVSRAVDLQREHPDLSGLPLLRAAMLSLPPTRRRRLIAVTQAPWFEPDVIADIKRRTTEARADAEAKSTRIVDHEADPYVPILRENTAANVESQRIVAEWRQIHEMFEAKAEQAREATIAILSLIHRELRTLNETLNQLTNAAVIAADTARVPDDTVKPRK